MAILIGVVEILLPNLTTSTKLFIDLFWNNRIDQKEWDRINFIREVQNSADVVQLTDDADQTANMVDTDLVMVNTANTLDMEGMGDMGEDFLQYLPPVYLMVVYQSIIKTFVNAITMYNASRSRKVDTLAVETAPNFPYVMIA